MNKKNKNIQDSPITPIKLGKNNNPTDPGWFVKKFNSKRNHSISSSSEPPTSPTTQSTNQKSKKKFLLRKIVMKFSDKLKMKFQIPLQNK